MKKADIEKLRQMDEKKLQLEANKLLKDMAKLKIDMKAGNVKDTNAVAKKKKELAVVLTILRQKRT